MEAPTGTSAWPTDFDEIDSFEALLEFRRRQREDGYTYDLNATSIGLRTPLTAHVRRLNLTDRAAIDLLPKDVQGVVWEGVKEFDKLQRANKAGRESPDSLDEAVLNNEKSMKAADAFFIASVLDIRQGDKVLTTKIVANDAERQRFPGSFAVHGIAAEDRVKWFMVCVDADSAKAANLKLFRGKSDAHVSNGAVGTVAAPSLYPVESAG
jgi:hypothetical protein